ncbi:polysaccharide pyruvyl transferase family protein [Aquibium pacificus]|uniref:polysaccharide pyruvyl transferase family protein n=1 Tax=Aquibium pacificus TaxID=3153579 RepID=UPI00349FC767
MEQLRGLGRNGPLIAWGIGESLNIDRQGGVVLPYHGPLPDYLSSFDLVGLRDWGTQYPWAPCPSCLLARFDEPPEISRHEIVVYEHKRIPVPIEGLPRLSNNGSDIEKVLSFLASAEVVITNSYHGAYWATLLGRRVVAIPNMSKMYRLRHAPVLSVAERWRRAVDLAEPYPKALAECRSATLDFYDKVLTLIGSTSYSQ